MYFSVKNVPEFRGVSRMAVAKELKSIYKDNTVITLSHFIGAIISLASLVFFAFAVLEVFGEEHVWISFILSGGVMYVGELFILNKLLYPKIKDRMTGT